MFVITDYMDGRFRWSQAPDELKDLAVEVSDSTIEMWRAVAALDAIVQKQLLAIDNQTQSKRCKPTKG